MLQRSIAVLFCFALVAVRSSAALTADELLLLTNKNVPQGLKLAEFYAEKRQAPANRIVELDLPTTEEVPADTYDRNVVPVVREFLRRNGLERKVKCIVTFYGVPIRISDRHNSDEDKQELANLSAEFNRLPADVEPVVTDLEKQAAALDNRFSPKSGTDLDSLAKRAEAGLRVIGARAAASADASEREKLQRFAVEKFEALVGPEGLIERRLIENAASRSTTQPTTATSRALESFSAYRAEMIRLDDHRYDADSRKRQRELARKNAGVFGYAHLLQAQMAYFQTENTHAAFDSELALLWWDYPRTLWINNPLHYANLAARTPPVVMTMRLDAAQTGTVSQMILASLRAENDGLKGRVVIDSRGLPITNGKGKPDPYGEYDQTLRNLADLVQAKTKLSMTFDDRPEVLKAGSARDVAVYMGWYSVDKYVPACEFAPGAVAWHLASFTMVTLRRDDPRCWARELLNDGAAATLGAVAEPYLQAFPRADDFFPLLFTGKLTLAEVYWRSVPMASWQISMIGDPLYVPYQKNPAIAVDDLPDRLKPLFRPPAAPGPKPTTMP